jgi:hypothetical protein
MGAALPQQRENLRTDNRVATLEAAKAELETSWRDWKAWAKLEGQSFLGNVVAGLQHSRA